MAQRAMGKIGSSIQDALDIAIEAVARGELVKGKKALGWVLEQDPYNATAWLWLACCLSDDRAKEECYRQVSEITGDY